MLCWKIDLFNFRGRMGEKSNICVIACKRATLWGREYLEQFAIFTTPRWLFMPHTNPWVSNECFGAGKEQVVMMTENVPH